MAAAVSRTSPVSDEIVQIRALIAENTNEHGLYLTVDKSCLLRKRLELVARMIRTMENEIAVHRIGEQDRAAAGVLDDLAGEFLSDAIDPPNGCRASLVSLMSANNETGVLQPIKQAAQLCRQYEVPLHVDATQSIGKTPFLLDKIGASAVTFTAHKVHGPVGIGALWLAGGVRIRPVFHGGSQQLEARPGTEPVALVAGMAEAIRLAVVEQDHAIEQMRCLRDRLEQRLCKANPTLAVVGRSADRLPSTSSIALVGTDRQSMLMALDMAGIACSSGAACSSGSSPPSHVLTAMGVPTEWIESVLRFGVSKFSTIEEMDRAADLISSTYNRLRRSEIVEN